MIDQDRARTIATGYLSRLGSNVDPKFFIITGDCEESFGWVFFYDDRRYGETGDRSFALKGNLPIVVLRSTGEIGRLPWNKNLEAVISAFAARLKESGDTAREE